MRKKMGFCKNNSVNKKIKRFESTNDSTQFTGLVQSFEDIYLDNLQFLKKQNISIADISLEEMEKINIEILDLS